MWQSDVPILQRDKSTTRPARSNLSLRRSQPLTRQVKGPSSQVEPPLSHSRTPARQVKASPRQCQIPIKAFPNSIWLFPTANKTGQRPIQPGRTPIKSFPTSTSPIVGQMALAFAHAERNLKPRQRVGKQKTLAHPRLLRSGGFNLRN